MQLLTEKWASVLDYKNAPAIKDSYRRVVLAQLLENQSRAMRAESQERAAVSNILNEAYAGPANASGVGAAGGDVTYGAQATGSNLGDAAGNAHMAGFDPIVINLVRRAIPRLIAFDVCGVQPMSMPTGLIFAMKSRYASQKGAEALYNEADPRQSSTSEDPSAWAAGDMTGFSDGTLKNQRGMSTEAGEQLGSDGTPAWNQMAFSIEKTSVVARTRALKAEYTMELAQDLKAVHGLDAENELFNILSTEILAEINREVIRDIYITAEVGAQTGTATRGVYDMDIDSDGRWSAEKYKGLMYRIEREANAIGHKTRRGRGNFIICSADVASALQMAGMLDYAPAVQNALEIDDTATTFAGILNGRYKVFIDPYMANSSDDQYFVVGYKGTSAYDAGMFYCPYVPLQPVRAQDPDTFQPKIGFKTRYGLAFNPQVELDKGVASLGDPTKLANSNYYFRKVLVKNL